MLLDDQLGPASTEDPARYPATVQKCPTKSHSSVSAQTMLPRTWLACHTTLRAQTDPITRIAHFYSISHPPSLSEPSHGLGSVTISSYR